jgi:hypothetical protein
MSRMSRISPIVFAAALLSLVLGACSRTEPGAGSPDASVAAPESDSTAPESTSSSPPTSESGTPSETDISTPSSGDGDQQDVAGVTEDFYHALGEQDGAGACALMSAAMQASIAGGAPDCASAVRTRSDSIAPAERDRLTKLAVDPGGVQIDGDAADVPATAMSAPGATTSEQGSVKLVKESGDWKVNGVS